MLKELFHISKTQSRNVSNAIIQLGDIDDSGKGKRFKSRFIQPGLAGYPGQYGNVLVKKETLDNSLNTIIGAPVIINHKDITPENADNERVGVISDAYYNEKDGWYWCEGVIWDETAQNLITDKKWSVSCSYDFLEQDDEGGTENNIPYDREFTKLNFVHLALVNNPRYERANIVFNSKTVKNFNPNNTNSELNKEKETEMALLDELKKLIKTVETDKCVNSDDVDKRKILREADAIAMKPASEFKGGEEEKFRTLTKKLEQLSYDKSSDTNVDNSKSDYFSKMNEVYSASMKMPETSQYVSRADRLKEAENYFGGTNQ